MKSVVWVIAASLLLGCGLQRPQATTGNSSSLQTSFPHTGAMLTSCASCHTADMPQAAVGTTSFNHSSIGSMDCVSCHSKPGATWAIAGGAGGAFVHSPVPTTCVSCHAVDRPAIAKYPGGGGTVNGHYTASDCYACHLPATATVIDFKFKHSNALDKDIGFCLPCHANKGMEKHAGDAEVDFNGAGNCYSCHNVQRKSWKE